MTVAPGDEVTYRGAACRVLAVEEVPTPAGGRVRIVTIQRPRAGQRRVFEVEVIPGPPPAEPDRTRFRS